MAKTKAQKVTLTAEERQAVIQACQLSWDYVKYDMMELAASEGQEYMTQDEVGEVAADASRPCDHGLSKELYQKFILLPQKEMNSILREAFPHKRYYL